MENIYDKQNFEATLDEITVKADGQFVVIKDRSPRMGAQTVILTSEEAIFVRDQINAALAAGMVAS